VAAWKYVLDFVHHPFLLMPLLSLITVCIPRACSYLLILVSSGKLLLDLIFNSLLPPSSHPIILRRAGAPGAMELARGTTITMMLLLALVTVAATTNGSGAIASGDITSTTMMLLLALVTVATTTNGSGAIASGDITPTTMVLLLLALMTIAATTHGSGTVASGDITTTTTVVLLLALMTSRAIAGGDITTTTTMEVLLLLAIMTIAITTQRSGAMAGCAMASGDTRACAIVAIVSSHFACTLMSLVAVLVLVGCSVALISGVSNTLHLSKLKQSDKSQILFPKNSLYDIDNVKMSEM